MEDEPKAREDTELLMSLQIRQRKWDWLPGDRQSACRCPFSFATTAPAAMRLDGQMAVSSQSGRDPRPNIQPRSAVLGGEAAPKTLPTVCGKILSGGRCEMERRMKSLSISESGVCVCVCGAFFSTAVSTIDSSRHILSKQPV